MVPIRLRCAGAALGMGVPLSRALAAAVQDGHSEFLWSAEEIEGATAEILSRPEFNAAQSPDFWRAVKDLLKSWLADWPAPAGSSGLAWLILIVAVLLAAYAVSVVLRDLGGGVSLRTLGGLNRPWDPWRALEGTASSWEDAMRKARLALAVGRVYEALWIAHRAFLGLLDQRELVDFAKWKTNRDYLAECPAGDRIYPLFEAVSQAYEEVVYGHRPLPAGGVEELLQRLEQAGRDEGVQ